MNEFLATLPFDIYELSLFHLVVKHGSFTRAAESAGLTQSAMTRQIQGMETSLGLELLERTTRAVRVTAAGDFLYRESLKLLGDVDQTLRRLKQEYGDARPEVRVGVSSTIGFAYLPGFFHANLRREPGVKYRMSHQTSAEILLGLESSELDIGVVSAPKRLPRGVLVTHRFEDAFTMVGPAPLADEFAALGRSTKRRAEWLERQTWLLMDRVSNTGQRLAAWMARQGWQIEPTMELSSFDLIINLVALGMGVSFVPIRALALYGRKRNVRRIALPVRFERQLVVAMRQQRKTPVHLEHFVAHVLF